MARNYKYSFLWSVILLVMTGCSSNGDGPTQPSPVLPPAASNPAPGASSPNGSFTWVQNITSRVLCPEINRQIGGSWRIWLKLEADGPAVTLTLSEAPLDNPDPMAEGPAIFEGTRNGTTITASRVRVNLGGLACPGDAGVTPQTGGDMTATVDGQGISGQYTEVYGTGASQVTAVFSFRATLLAPVNP